MAGKNSFTEAQAKSRIEEAGYKDVAGLKLDDQGVWRATASKDGAPANVSLDFPGNITLAKTADAPTQARMQYIDYGLSVLHRDVIAGIAETVFDLAAVFHRLSLAGRLAGYEVTERFYEIGSPEGLRDLEQYLAS